MNNREIHKLSNKEIREILNNHLEWLKTRNTNNVKGANVNHSDFKCADIDFSCLPLWCGSLNVHFDDRQLKQIAYHLVRAGLQSKNASKETKSELNKLVDFANGFHRVNECGLIEEV